MQAVVGRKGQENSGQSGPGLGGEPGQGQLRQYRRPGEEQQHQHARGVNARLEILQERQHGQLEQQVAPRRETIVGVVARCAVRIQGEVFDPREAALRGHIRRHHQVIGGYFGVQIGPVKQAPVRVRREQGRQSRQQQQQGNAMGAEGLEFQERRPPPAGFSPLQDFVSQRRVLVSGGRGCFPPAVEFPRAAAASTA